MSTFTEFPALFLFFPLKASLPNSQVNYDDAGIKISSTRHTEDRMVLSSLGAARVEKGIRVTNAAPAYSPLRRLDAWGKPLNLPPSERTYEQKRFEMMGNRGGQRGGVVGMDPQLAAQISKSSKRDHTFGSGRGDNFSSSKTRSPHKVVRLKCGSPTRVARQGTIPQQQAVSPAFDRNSWRL